MAANGDIRPRQWVKEAQEAIAAFYTHERLLQICDLALERLLGLRPADLEVRDWKGGGGGKGASLGDWMIWSRLVCLQ